MDASTAPRPLLRIGDSALSLDDVARWSQAPGARVEIAAAAREKTARGAAALERHLERGHVVYGVTTGFGDSCQTEVPAALVQQLPNNLFRFHGCGVGEDFTPAETRAILLARLASLTHGSSGVRPELLDALAGLLSHDVLPCIPTLGSVGASGDLTPLSYVAAVLAGEREALVQGQRLPASEALVRAGLQPLSLRPKESLALMNGTSAMTGVAALCAPRSLRLARWAAALTAVSSDVLRGEPRHFDARLFKAKPHPGQALVAQWIREDLEFETRSPGGAARVQDRYSLRCAPHVIGVLVDLLPIVYDWLETELNGANDNPLIDSDTGDVLHGGNFYGGHVCSAMDSLKTQVANLADLLDRQLALLCNPVTNHGLPNNLVGTSGAAQAAHHGFKAMQITTSALAAEAAKLTIPASVFSRSTENHNQDKVSMGTIAARDCSRILDLTEQVAAILTLACVQAVDLRDQAGCHTRALALHRAVRAHVPFVEEDRAMQADIQTVVELARQEQLPLGASTIQALR